MPRAGLPAFAVCAVSFLVGVVAGTIVSSSFAGGDAAAEYLSGYIVSLREGTAALRFWPLFVETGWYHLLAFLLGFTVLGAALIPALAAFRGFTLAFSLATLVRVYSVSGAAAGAVLVGVSALFSVPLFFPLASDGMCASFELLRTGILRLPPSGPGVTYANFIRFIAVLFFLLLIALGERALLLSGFLDLPIFP